MAELTGTVTERAEGAARATNHADMDGMREALLHFLELDDYLSDQAIRAIVLPGAERWLPRQKGACLLRSSVVIIISECSRWVSSAASSMLAGVGKKLYGRRPTRRHWRTVACPPGLRHSRQRGILRNWECPSGSSGLTVGP
jgi:hypothetical protein